MGPWRVACGIRQMLVELSRCSSERLDAWITSLPDVVKVDMLRRLQLMRSRLIETLISKLDFFFHMPFRAAHRDDDAGSDGGGEEDDGARGIDEPASDNDSGDGEGKLIVNDTTDEKNKSKHKATQTELERFSKLSVSQSKTGLR